MRKPGSRPITVASVPAGHPYVAGLGLTGAGIEVLADPPVTGAPRGRWWPPAMLDPAWIQEHRSEFALMHIHFGVESLTLDDLARVVDALRRAQRPLVHTIHDLSHPQLDAQVHHDAQLAMLVDAADALITLTPGAAAEIAVRFAREATVIAHPAMRRPGPAPLPAAGRRIVGVHLRDLRPNIDGPGTVTALDEALRRLPGVHGAIYLHDHVRDAAAAATVRCVCERSSRLSLLEGPRPGDTDLERELSALAVSLLPYRHGTHSGWLELCVDLGVPVAAPSIGHLADQHPEVDTVASFRLDDAGSLSTTLAALLAQPAAVAGSAARTRDVAERARRRASEHAGLARAHRAVYDDVLAGRRPLSRC